MKQRLRFLRTAYTVQATLSGALRLFTAFQKMELYI